MDHSQLRDAKAALDLAKAATEIGKKIIALIRRVEDRAIKEELEQVLNESRDLKHMSIALEDENRELREKLRFNEDDYPFRGVFRFHKDQPDEPLCPKCFATRTIAHMSEPGADGVQANYRRCSVCRQYVKISPDPQRPYTGPPDGTIWR